MKKNIQSFPLKCGLEPRGFRRQTRGRSGPQVHGRCAASTGFRPTEIGSQESSRTPPLCARGQLSPGRMGRKQFKEKFTLVQNNRTVSKEQSDQNHGLWEPGPESRLLSGGSTGQKPSDVRAEQGPCRKHYSTHFW